MLYSESELKKRLKAGCPVFYFYAGDEAKALLPESFLKSRYFRQSLKLRQMGGVFFFVSFHQLHDSASFVVLKGGRRLRYVVHRRFFKYFFYFIYFH